MQVLFLRSKSFIFALVCMAMSIANVLVFMSSVARLNESLKAKMILSEPQILSDNGEDPTIRTRKGKFSQKFWRP